MKYKDYSLLNPKQQDSIQVNAKKVTFAEKLDDFLNYHFNAKIASAIYQPAKNQKLLDTNTGGVETSPAFSVFARDLISFYNDYRELLITYFQINWIDQDTDIVTNLSHNHLDDKKSNYDVPTILKTERQKFKPVAMHLAALNNQLANFDLS